MKKFIVVAILVVMALSIQQRDHRPLKSAPRHEDWNDFSKSITKECCTSLGGK